MLRDPLPPRPPPPVREDIWDSDGLMRMSELRLIMPSHWLPSLHAVAKKGERATWMRRVILHALRQRGMRGLVDVGDYMGIDKRNARARARWRERQRRKREGLTKPRRPPVVVSVTPDDTFVASDLDGRLAGLVYSDGGIASESRHGFEVLLGVLRDHWLRDGECTSAQLAALERYDGWADDRGRLSHRG